jgi:AraC-like DNA-binding protein
LKKIFRRQNAHDLRDQAIRYIVEEIGEHDLAHMSGDGWYNRISFLKVHDHAVSDILGTSERTFRRILKKQHHMLTPAMLKSEEHLIKKEIDDIDYLIDFLEALDEENHHRRIQMHIRNLRSYTKKLSRIQDNFHKWFLADKEEHRLLKKGIIRQGNVHSLLEAESEADMIDINKVYLLFQNFEKEKVSILKDLELLGKNPHKKKD